MRIVIDMQGAQRADDDSAVRHAALGFALALVQQGGNEVHLVLNSALPARIEELRLFFDGWLAPQFLHCFDALATTAIQGNAALALPHAASIVREYFIACLQPDVVVITSLFEGYADAAVTSISAFPSSAVQAVLFHESIVLGNGADLPELQFIAEKCAQLRHADLVLAWSAETPAALASTLEMAPERLLVLGSTPPAAAVDWNKAANAALAALALSCERAPVFAPERKRRLAFVSPFPPERTGIADYAVQLLPAMLEHFDIELIVHQSEVALPEALSELRLRDVAWFADNAHLYDQILYQFGNSAFHSHMFGLLQDHPGVVVLHDFYLSNVLAYEQMTGDIPHAWAKALLRSHGYAALHASQVDGNHDGAMRAYPCNLEVLETATGVIVHSEHSADLARQWYGPNATANWTIVPLPRTAPVRHGRDAARAALGIAPGTFLVCSFGYVAPGKLSDVLVAAWIASNLHADAQCELVLVGANHSGQYGDDIVEAIRASGSAGRISIAGWTDAATYQHYLQAADAGVQLRTSSRGETSAAVLDCMNYGLPTIVNANGSMAAISPDAVWQLPDDFTMEALAGALETLRNDAGQRLALGAKAATLMETSHRPSTCASLYHAALDIALLRERSGEAALLRALGALPGLLEDETMVRQLATSLACAPVALVQQQLLIDVTAIVQNNLKTGVERVVRTQLLALLRTQLPGVRVEPVYLSTEGNRWHYRYARRYAGQLLGIAWTEQPDPVVDVQAGDIYYTADYSPIAVCEAARAGVYADWRARGVGLNFLVHDMLPVLHPEFFPSTSTSAHACWLNVIGTEADRLIALSTTLRSDLTRWLEANPPSRQRPLHLGVLGHGADMPRPTAAPAPMLDWPLLDSLRTEPTFLMVGPLSSRKGHLQTIAAFDELWRRGVHVRLAVVGGEDGQNLAEDERRMIPEIVAQLTHHPELGKRLFWMQELDETCLQQVYAASTCLLAPSEAEGSGLSLMEAARVHLPVIARDLHVFREVAGDGLWYFSGRDAASLADAVEGWLAAHAQGIAPALDTIRWSTWHESVVSLLALVNGKSNDQFWQPSQAAELTIENISN